MALDRERLAKLLAMTASDKDGEALNAMRMANRVIEAAGLTWAEVLEQQAAVSVRIFDMTPARSPPWEDDERLSNRAVIDEMFRTIYGLPQDGSEFWSWLDDVKSRYDKHGRLTKGQYDGVRRSYARAMRSRRT